MRKANPTTLLCLVLIVWLMKFETKCSAEPNHFNISSSKNRLYNIHDDDEASLSALKHRITTNNTMLSENWTQEVPFCTWIGVTCSRRHPLRVTALNLSYMGLSGTIPEEIGNLSFLSYLDMKYNKFHGPIPETIGKLHRLRVLIMNNNQLNGRIPASIFNISSLQQISLGWNELSGNIAQNVHLPNLKKLSLWHNQLMGTFPSAIYNLSSLQGLYLDINQFSGTLPHEMDNYLPNLRELDLSDNQISGNIPESIFNISFLEWIDLGGNQLSGNIPDDILSTNLQILSLSRNKLVGEIPSRIFNVTSIQQIYLYSNQLSGTLHDLNICRNLLNLQVLSLSGNLIRGDLSFSTLWECAELNWLSIDDNNFTGRIPMRIGNFSRLQTLHLHQNRLTGIIPTSIGNLSKLEDLRIGYNNIHGKIPSEIGQLSELHTLGLGVSMLNGEVPVSLYNLSKLQNLSIADNELFGELPSSIAIGLPNLKELYIGANRFSGVIPPSISNLSRLSILDVGINSFTGHIPVNLGNLLNLELLSLQDNHFTNNLSISEQDFISHLANCKDLKIIEFNSNPTIIGELPTSFFSSDNVSDTLESFIASSCGINGEIPAEIGNLNSLIVLGFNGNKLVGEIPESFRKLVKLQQLALDNNTLQGSIAHSICNMTNLYFLRLSGNKFSGQLPLCLGTDLPALREIYLSENAFSSNIPSNLWSNGAIEKIYLDHNFLDGDLPNEIGNLKSLFELNISGNQLSGIIPDSIGQLLSLNILSLSNNRLNGSIPDSFSNLKGLEILDLSHNNLSGPIPKTLASLAHLEYFNVSFNQLSGEIPSEGAFRNFTAECFIGNKDLCGAARLKVEPCKYVKPKPLQKIRLVLRYVPPVVLTFSIFVVATIIFIIRKKYSKVPPFLPDFLGLSLERISYNAIVRATSNFDGRNLIGRGSFGSVYKGEFPGAVVVAVKVFNLDVQGALKSFDIECQILRSIRHRNLVKVVTCCSNLDFKALVMEYMLNGNLDKWLHSIEYSLNIFQRFGIITDVAVALEYLHHGSSTPIIHCDLKPTNILLDEDMVAHVGDFGISKLLTEEEIVRQTKTLGTIGYMAPEYGCGGFISTAADIYSFGVVVMETFTRKKPTDEMFSEESTMKKWVSESIPDYVSEIFDFELLNTSEEDVRDRYERCLISIIELALECTTDKPEERPSMNEVASKIKKIKSGLQVN